MLQGRILSAEEKWAELEFTLAVHRSQDASFGTGRSGWDAPLEVLNKEVVGVQKADKAGKTGKQDLELVLKIFMTLCRAGLAGGSAGNLKPGN